MPTDLFLVRHGAYQLATELNDEGRFDSPLSDLGRSQAVALAQRFSDAGLGGIPVLYHSPLRRARQTAEILAKRLGGDAALEARDGLAECRWGELEAFDTDSPEWEARYDAAWAGGRWEQWPGGDSREEFRSRTTSAVSELVDEGGSPVVAVTHGTVINEVLCTLLGLGAVSPFLPWTSSVTIVRVGDDGGVRVVSYNDVWHLDDPLDPTSPG